MIRDSQPLFEAGVWYDREQSYARRPRGFGLDKIYLYRWFSPSGHAGIDHVYVARYEDFKTLLGFWSRQGWTYAEIADL